MREDDGLDDDRDDNNDIDENIDDCDAGNDDLDTDDDFHNDESSSMMYPISMMKAMATTTIIPENTAHDTRNMVIHFSMPV